MSAESAQQPIASAQSAQQILPSADAVNDLGLPDGMSFVRPTASLLEACHVCVCALLPLKMAASFLLCHFMPGPAIAVWKARLETLLQDMSTRQAGGCNRSGRYKKDDTARRHFINTTALPNLRAGILPTDEEERLLFLGPMQSLSLSEKTDLQRWINTVYTDPRAHQSPSQQDVKRQTLLLDWAQKNAKVCAVPAHTARDAASGYIVGFGKYKGLTVDALVKQAQATQSGKNNGAGWWLLWVCGQRSGNSLGSFNWRWSDFNHVRLFLGLHAAWRRSSWKLPVRTHVQDQCQAPEQLDIRALVQAFYVASGITEWRKPTNHQPLDPDDDEGAVCMPACERAWEWCCRGYA